MYHSLMRELPGYGYAAGNPSLPKAPHTALPNQQYAMPPSSIPPQVGAYSVLGFQGCLESHLYSFLVAVTMLVFCPVHKS